MNNNGIEIEEYEMMLTFSNVGIKGASCNVEFTTITNDNKNEYLLKTEVEKVNSTYNDGHRYSGKEPDNWIWFNNEFWRIIGSVPTCTDATMAEDGYTGTCNQEESAKPRLVKIMRGESIGGIAYHNANSNLLWGSGNTLYNLLNNYYYGKRNATGLNPCLGYGTNTGALCNYTHIGISDDPNDYYGKMIEEVYMNGRRISASKKIDAAYDLEAATVTKKTKVGLITASDYGYATSGITYNSIELSSLDTKTKNNYIYGQSYERTMTPAGTSCILNIYEYGNVGCNSGVTTAGYVTRPVVYLDSNVYIINGNGTQSNPYIIGIN
jgi:hypothetical protein